MSAIIAEKQIVVKAIDKVTEPLALMDQRLNNLVQKYDALSQKMQTSASGQQAFKASLNEVKASASETAEATTKLDHAIAGLHDKKVKVNADTTEANSKTEELNGVIKQLAKDSPTITPKVHDDEAKDKLTLLQRIVGRVKSSGESMTKSFVIGGLVTSGIQSVATSLKGFAIQGFQAAQAGTLVANRWKSLGMTASEIKATGAAVADLKENTGMTGAAVGNLVTRFYGLTGSARQAIALSKGVGSITDSLRLSGNQADAFANGLTRIESSGKVTSQSLGRLEKQAPGLTSALQKASGMSKKSFDDLLSSGKMTASQFNDILERASKDYQKNAKGWDSTTQGALNNIKQTWANSWKTMMAPLAQSSGQGLGALSKSLQTLQPEFKQLGEAVADLATKFAKWLTPQHAKDLGEIVSSLGRMALVLGKGVWKAVTIPLQLIGKAINAMTGKKGDALDSVATALDHISKNKIAMGVLEGIGAVLATQLAYGKLFKIASGLFKINGALGKISGIKFSGHLFSDLFTNLGRLSHVHGLSAGKEWLSGFTSKLGKGSFSLKNFFVGAPKDASIAGDLTGSTFISRFAQKTRAGRFAELGRGLAGKLGAGITIGLSAIDVARGLTPSFRGDRWKEVGKGAGGLIGGGIGMYFAGPAGAAVGSMIGNVVGSWLGKAAHKGFNFMRDVFHGRITFSGIEHGFAQTMSKVGKWAQNTWKRIKDWWNQDPTKEGRKKADKTNRTPSQHEIRSLGGNHYSKADIANVKEMNRAITAYTRSLKTLKQTIKRNDPTKELNVMNKRLKQFVKELQKEVKSLGKAAKTFRSFGKSTKTMSSSIKSLTGKHGLGEFDKDISKLDKDMKHSKVGEYFEKLAKSIKKSKLADEFKSLAKYLGSMVKGWEHLVKPLKMAEKEFQNFEKVIGKLANKKTGLSKVDSDLKTLSKDLVKYNFAKTLSKQMQAADKAVGKDGFVKQFDSMVHRVESDLRSFSKTFSREWGSVWKNLGRGVSRGLDRAEDAESRGFSSMRSKESHFESGFKHSWSDWIDDVVSAFRSGFNKLPGIAAKAMSEIVSRLNKGISGINSVISDFGGDKKLNTISYAHGTLAHPGGKALLNDGLTANKTELFWQPSKGWGVAQGQNVVRDLEAGSMVIDAPHSAPALSQFGSQIPHYANGNLSDEEMDKIAEQFENNPVASSRSLMLKLTNWSSSTPIIPSFGKALAIGFSRSIANVLKDLLGEVKEPVNGDWTPVIRSAAAKLHFHIADWQIKKLLRQIQTESGGNEKISQQISDINSAEGHPAQGLLQFIPSTFNTWALPGHHNILSGFDQIMAAINALNHGGEGGWGNIGNGHGWASGVHMTHPDFALIGDNAEHDEYVINPYNSQSVPLMRDAWRTMENVHPELRSTSAGTAFNAQVVELLRETVSTIKNIDLQPVLPVDETRRMINKQNATDWRMAMKG